MTTPAEEAKEALASGDKDRIRACALTLIVARLDLAEGLLRTWLDDRDWYGKVPLWLRLLSLALVVVTLLALLTGCITWGWLLYRWQAG